MTIDLQQNEFGGLDEQLKTNQRRCFNANFLCILLLYLNGQLLIFIPSVYENEPYYRVPIIIISSLVVAGIYLLVKQLKYSKKLYQINSILRSKYLDELKSKEQTPPLEEDSLYFYRD